MDADECLEVISAGRFHVLAVVVCGLANAAVAVELMSIGYILPALNGVEVSAKAAPSAPAFLGMLVGGVVSGRVGDKFGRKPGMLACVRAASAPCVAPGGRVFCICMLPPFLIDGS
jgi:MFS family permease